ncbi:nucleoporin NUP159 [Acrasis kona]|uniref:Nucleoporin NUP159 n=1 Tax=Acrasis kona TaxID=1008807 RepID=A0AAW2YWT6_9EUKA
MGICFALCCNDYDTYTTYGPGPYSQGPHYYHTDMFPHHHHTVGYHMGGGPAYVGPPMGGGAFEPPSMGGGFQPSGGSYSDFGGGAFEPPSISGTSGFAN